ncbi:MAG: TerB family tellurite resistance protein [Gammaproteobacteria bacterium]|nr:TerB family tellurite resistance protein [Gammaproteobacteria bacterium]
MSIRNLSHIKKLFEHVDNPDEKRELYKEMLLMTLSRATRADLVTDDTEVAIVQKVVLEATGEEVSVKCVRTAASSELYETAPIDKYLSRVGQKIDLSQRQSIVKALVAVFEADGQVTESETDFFNMVVGALKLSPAEAAGLVVETV